MNIKITILNILILLFMPFFVLFLIRKTKAFWGARKGISIGQVFFDLLKLFKKDRVVSNTTSYVFNIAPCIIFVSTFIAGLFAPILKGYPVIDTLGAFIIFSYTLGLGKFFSLISAMDTGSAFEGMGASREACFTTIVEPAFFLILGSIALISNDLTFQSFSKIFSLTDSSSTFTILIIMCAILALTVMLLAECSRVPVDDPSTHLELTMIHEVMILDNSGVDLALISWASGMKMVILMNLIANLIIPNTLGNLVWFLSYFLFITIFSIVIGTIEATVARLRMSHVFEFIFVMSSFALVCASLVIVKTYGA